MLQECLPAFFSALAENTSNVDKILSFPEASPVTQSHTLLQQVLAHSMSRILELGLEQGLSLSS